MSNLVRRPGAQPVAPSTNQVLNAQVAAAESPGIVAVARLQAGAFATSVALQNAVMLSRSANAAFRSAPLGEELYQSIVAAYGTLAVSEIQSLAMRGRS
jgi:hypothetical protein